MHLILFIVLWVMPATIDTVIHMYGQRLGGFKKWFVL